MGLISFNHKGNFKKTEQFFNRALRRDYLNVLDHYGQIGVEALRNNTPTASGKTADSWNYGIEKDHHKITLYWTNSNENNGVNIAILLLYGHALQNGGYVEGIDYVTPALQPLFQEIAEKCWKEVVR